jgi:small neutral amino acid transporter SnatA (MarC family)
VDDLLRTALILVCAVNPPAFALATLDASAGATTEATRASEERRRGDPRHLAVHAGIALAILVLLALAADRIQDLLDVSAPTFELGAAAILGVAALQPLIFGRDLLPLPGTWTALASPAVIAAAIALSARYSLADAILGSAVAVALALALALRTATLATRPRPDDRLRRPLALTARLIAALLVLLAFALAVDAIKRV